MHHLQDHVDEAKQHLIQLHQEDLFLNVDEPKCEWEWASASQLIYNAPDGSGFKAARSFLNPFERLILASGGAKVKRVKAEAPPPSEPEAVLADFRTSFQSLRESETLTDVVFVEKSGKKHPAHRAFLVASSSYFRSMFAKAGMKEARSAGSNDPVEVGIAVDLGANAIRDALGEGLALPSPLSFED